MVFVGRYSRTSLQCLLKHFQQLLTFPMVFNIKLQIAKLPHQLAIFPVYKSPPSFLYSCTWFTSREIIIKCCRCQCLAILPGFSRYKVLRSDLPVSLLVLWDYVAWPRLHKWQGYVTPSAAYVPSDHSGPIPEILLGKPIPCPRCSNPLRYIKRHNHCEAGCN